MYLFDTTSYREWRAAKLGNYPQCTDDLIVKIGALASPGDSAIESILASFRRANMAIYTCGDTVVDRPAILAFAAHFGLQRIDHHLCANDDGVSELAVAGEDRRGGYVPYSNRSLSWHTDGYYNDASRQIHAVILHCAQDSASGGQSALLDPEMAYIRLRDENPAFIEALEHPECLTIPANIEDGHEIRPAVSGPVFSYHKDGAVLHMRYSARKKNIRWRDDATTSAAREYLSALLADDDGLVMHYRLQPGEGLISNNVLHNRTAFEDGPSQKRLLYRARFFDRIGAQA